MQMVESCDWTWVIPLCYPAKRIWCLSPYANTFHLEWTSNRVEEIRMETDVCACVAECLQYRRIRRKIWKSLYNGTQCGYEMLKNRQKHIVFTFRNQPRDKRKCYRKWLIKCHHMSWGQQRNDEFLNSHSGEGEALIVLLFTYARATSANFSTHTHTKRAEADSNR